LRSVEFWYPTQGAGSLAKLIYNQMCAGCPISVGGEPPDPVISMELFTSNVEITDALLYDELTVGTGSSVDAVELNTEAAPDYCDLHIEAPTLDSDGQWKIIFDQALFTTIAADTYWGAVISADFGDGTVIIAVAKFDEVVTPESGDLVKVSGVLPIVPAVPLVP